MNVNQEPEYRVVSIFDRWSDDEVADHEDEEAQATAVGQPLPRLGAATYQEAVLGGTFARVPTEEEIDGANAAAASFIDVCDGRGEARGHAVVDRRLWNVLVGSRADAVDAAARRLSDGGFPAAAVAARWRTADALPPSLTSMLNVLRADRHRWLDRTPHASAWVTTRAS